MNLPYAAAAIASAILTGCAHLGPATHLGNSGVTRHVPAQHAATTTTSVDTTAPVAWGPDQAALAVAETYAKLALSYTWNTGPDAWIDRVAPLCTPQWAAQLRASGDGGGGGWAAVVAHRQSATASILAVYPAYGPGPGRRLVATAQVSLTGAVPATGSMAIAVDLLPGPGGSWLVGWAG
jgi:hypothetical protein